MHSSVSSASNTLLLRFIFHDSISVTTTTTPVPRREEPMGGTHWDFKGSTASITSNQHHTRINCAATEGMHETARARALSQAQIQSACPLNTVTDSPVSSNRGLNKTSAQSILKAAYQRVWEVAHNLVLSLSPRAAHVQQRRELERFELRVQGRCGEERVRSVALRR